MEIEGMMIKSSVEESDRMTKPIIHPNWHRPPENMTEGFFLEITAKDVEAIGHADTPDDPVRKGHDIEHHVLATAERHHLDGRVFLNGTRTFALNARAGIPTNRSLCHDAAYDEQAVQSRFFHDRLMLAPGDRRFAERRGSRIDQA